MAGVSIYIPESWLVTCVIESQYAIFQSYPQDKYVGGEMLESGDTKCDLNIQPTGASADDLIQGWRSDELTTIVSEGEIVLQSGLTGQRLVLESMGRSVALVTEINNRAVVLNCYGNPEPFEGIAITLSGFKVEASPIQDSVEDFKQYQDSETGVTLDVPGNWVITGIIPGQRATLQSFPENKYVGGEALNPGDTKCDLFIRNDISADEFISEMRTNQTIIIISKYEIKLNSVQTVTRIEMESMGHSALVIAEFNERVVVLTCFGDFALVDEIAVTLKAGE